ncbi:MAG: hypothetical protein AAF702_49830 [Chloroflexota bacterium]
MSAYSQTRISVSGATAVLDTSFTRESTLADLLAIVAPRIAIDQAKARQSYPLAIVTTLAEKLQQVMSRIRIEQAKVGFTYALRYPVDLIKDTTGPQRTSEVTVVIESTTSAKLAWQTDEYSRSVVRYGSTPGNLSESVTDADYQKAHSTTLPGLVSGTTIYYQVTITDRSNNATQLAESSFVMDEMGAPFPTATATSSSATPAVTSTPTSSIRPTPTVNPPATPGTGDPHESDEICAQATAIEVDGESQRHTLHQTADVDWVRFDATTGTTYRVEVTIPDGSPADVNLELHTSCGSLPTETWNATFTPGVRLDFSALSTEPIYLRLQHQDERIFGDHVAYDLSVRTLSAEPSTGAVILVAGRIKGSDPLQTNIHNVTNDVFKLFSANGYTAEDITYLATDANLVGYDAAATKANLESAIVDWAVERLQSQRSLTLYLMDHGDKNRLYLDGLTNETVTPDELDGWLTVVEEKVPGVKINVIIEMCHAGSFIDGPQSISKEGRVVITSTNVDWDAYASRSGAHFSDYFITSLQQGRNLFTSFSQARSFVTRLYPLQQPWVDSNGDQEVNREVDYEIAAQRGFAYKGTFPGTEDSWPPYIAQASEPERITNRRGTIQAEVRDDQQVDLVWAVVYGPAYAPAESGQELVPESLPNIILQPQGNNQYEAEYAGFDEVGGYRIVVHAKDSEGHQARPITLQIEVGRRVYLPLVR